MSNFFILDVGLDNLTSPNHINFTWGISLATSTKVSNPFLSKSHPTDITSLSSSEIWNCCVNSLICLDVGLNCATSTPLEIAYISLFKSYDSNKLLEYGVGVIITSAEL